MQVFILEKLHTTDDVKRYILLTEKEIEKVSDLRQKYRNKLRNCTDNDLIQEYKNKRNECTVILNKHRQNIKLANDILEDTPRVKETIKIEKQMKFEQENTTKVKKKYRYDDIY